jgi:hypothetical protein
MTAPTDPQPRTIRLLAVLALVTSVAAPAAAQGGFAIGVRAGTTGIGPELACGLTPHLDARLASGYYSYDDTYDATGVHYDGTFDLRNAMLLLDWHPGGGGFRLTAGAGWNGNRLQVQAPISELVRRYRPDLPSLPVELGSVHGEATGQTLAPYAGLGWGRPLGGSGRWSFSVDLGALYLGSPQVDLETRLAFQVPPAAQQILDLAVADEERRLEDELDQYRYLPVLSFGLMVRL